MELTMRRPYRIVPAHGEGRVLSASTWERAVQTAERLSTRQGNNRLIGITRGPILVVLVSPWVGWITKATLSYQGWSERYNPNLDEWSGAVIP